MFGLGFSEMILIAIIALIFIGPKQLPEVARTLARFINELRRTTDELTRSVHTTTSEINKNVVDDSVNIQKVNPSDLKPSAPSITHPQSIIATDSHKDETVKPSISIDPKSDESTKSNIEATTTDKPISPSETIAHNDTVQNSEGLKK